MLITAMNITTEDTIAITGMVLVPVNHAFVLIKLVLNN